MAPRLLSFGLQPARSADPNEICYLVSKFNYCLITKLLNVTIMKLAIISTILASATAFAPASTGRASTQVSETKVRVLFSNLRQQTRTFKKKQKVESTKSQDFSASFCFTKMLIQISFFIGFRLISRLWERSLTLL